MTKPVLVIIAGGLGSRYGGVKQIEPVDDAGNWFMDYAMYDAMRAGFETAVLVVSPTILDDIRETIGKRVGGNMEIKYSVQRLEDIPVGRLIPEGRVKPWGTGHAAYSARDNIEGPFAVVNADDFYGADAYVKMVSFLSNRRAGRHAMVGYALENTLTDYGHVSRAICETDGAELLSATERKKIMKTDGGAFYFDENGNEVFIPGIKTVSLNFFGFGAEVLDEMERGFTKMLDEKLDLDPLLCEYGLPSVADSILASGSGGVSVLSTDSRWLGVTYAEDMPKVRSEIAEMKKRDEYPADLWKRGS